MEVLGLAGPEGWFAFALLILLVFASCVLSIAFSSHDQFILCCPHVFVTRPDQTEGLMLEGTRGLPRLGEG